ncbi:MAG: peptidoglycan DD-metalloendopeptidase family protein [Deltaproteobacteria bacterium]|uniref:Peptidoglycan DD-metalloendopeptidase family protein n=1 Tax=Candidatus Zymogenus saltonus TaxID=2844893 RepID=A0A9D8KCQ2_9DELT|nr:peptidoglycan DD-metalloendopeptidase family protein [Candidatus Zymogenus saltonus]
MNRKIAVSNFLSTLVNIFKSKKYFTIIIVPQKAQKVHKFKISDLSLTILGVLTLFFIIISGFMLFNYFELVSKATTVGDLRETNMRQKEKIREFQDKIDTLEAQMEKIRQFDEKLRIITNIGEYTKGEEMFGVGGPLPEEGESVTDVDKYTKSLMKEISVDLDKLQEESKLREESIQELLSFLEDQKNILASTPSIWPARGFITSGFGYRRSPYTKTLRMHEGLDIANKVGTAVIAPADGIVVFAGIEGGYGKLLTIDHGYGIATRYGHLDSILVKEGDKIKRGAKIGTIGQTGLTTGPHLHYEVRVNSVPVNPKNYILN